MFTQKKSVAAASAKPGQTRMNADGTTSRNIDLRVVAGFGDEWKRFHQGELDATELKQAFDEYFGIFPWERLPSDAEGFDMGCGSGRWARVVAPRVGKLNCIDPSEQALAVARRNLAAWQNCSFHCSSLDEVVIPQGSQDFGYCLGVLHHVPHPVLGLKSCAGLLKPGAPFLVYLYYAFDNRPVWFRMVWRVSNLVRGVLSRLPHGLRYGVSQLIALFIYWPLARIAKLAEFIGANVSNYPLSYYRRRSFYTMRTDALDRFGTRLEHRFSRTQIARMLDEAGFENASFSNAPPFWCAIAYRKTQ